MSDSVIALIRELEFTPDLCLMLFQGHMISRSMEQLVEAARAILPRRCVLVGAMADGIMGPGRDGTMREWERAQPHRGELCCAVSLASFPGGTVSFWAAAALYNDVRYRLSKSVV